MSHDFETVVKFNGREFEIIGNMFVQYFVRCTSETRPLTTLFNPLCSRKCSAHARVRLSKHGRRADFESKTCLCSVLSLLGSSPQFSSTTPSAKAARVVLMPGNYLRPTQSGSEAATPLV